MTQPNPTMNKTLHDALTELLRGSGYRLVHDNVPRTHHLALNHLNEHGTVREWQQVMMYATVFQLTKDIPGDIAEFGVASGTSFKSFVRMNEIHNRQRSHDLAKKWVVGFDTFDGLPPLDPAIDLITYKGADPGDMKEGGYQSRGTLPQLQEFCAAHQHCRLVEGLFSDTLPKYFAENPHASFSFIHIDCDIYQSTMDALMPMMSRLNVGGVILFDEIFHDGFPGETQAFIEVYDRFRNDVTLEFKRVESMPWKWYCVRTR